MQALNPLAIELNERLRDAAPAAFALLSALGKRIYLPKGILSQTAEANTHAHRFNATRAIALDFSHDVVGELMHLPVSRALVPEFTPESVYSYAPVLGQQALREAWKTHLLKENPSLAEKTFSLPIVTSGMTHGFSLLAELFVNSGNTLVLPDKIWGNYRLIFETKAGATLQTYPFFNAANGFNTHGFHETLANATDEKLLVLLNFPHNPTGYAVTRAEARQIVDALVARAEAGCRLLVMIDDAYARSVVRCDSTARIAFRGVGRVPPECSVGEDRWCYERRIRMGITCGVCHLRTQAKRRCNPLNRNSVA